MSAFQNGITIVQAQAALNFVAGSGMAFITMSNKERSDLLFEELIPRSVADRCWRRFISG